MNRYVRPKGSEVAKPFLGRDVSGSRFAMEYPAVWEYLTADSFDDGKPRQTSTVTLFVEGGLCKVVLRDREAQQALFASGETVEGVLASLEGMLVDALADWRMDRKGPRKM